MEFIKSWKFALIIFGVLCVVAIVGVVVGVITHSEAGFDERTPEWERGDFPLPVCVVSYSRGEEVTDVSDEAQHASRVMGLINDRLDFQAFVLAVPARDRIDRCHIVVEYDVPVDVGHNPGGVGAEPGGYADIGDQSCHVGLVNSVGELRSLVLQHELGHCLGLAHDDFNTSIMRPVQSVTEYMQYPAQITDHDRSLLRDAYAP